MPNTSCARNEGRKKNTFLWKSRFSYRSSDCCFLSEKGVLTVPREDEKEGEKEGKEERGAPPSGVLRPNTLTGWPRGRLWLYAGV